MFASLGRALLPSSPWSSANDRGNKAGGGLPVRKAEDEELNEGRVQQELLVFRAEVREARDALGPLPDHLHGVCQQVVELLDVAGLLLLVGADFCLDVLKTEKRSDR